QARCRPSPGGRAEGPAAVPPPGRRFGRSGARGALRDCTAAPSALRELRQRLEGDRRLSALMIRVQKVERDAPAGCDRLAHPRVTLVARVAERRLPEPRLPDGTYRSRCCSEKAEGSEATSPRPRRAEPSGSNAACSADSAWRL